jgi:hypothetical protein
LVVDVDFSTDGEEVCIEQRGNFDGLHTVETHSYSKMETRKIMKAFDKHFKVDRRKNIFTVLHRHGVDFAVEINPRTRVITWRVDGELYSKEVF